MSNSCSTWLIHTLVKYVALLAFHKIVTSHPHLVSLHQDVILDCIDDADVTIRMRALDLVVGMVNSDNLTAIVERLMRQLRNAPIASAADDPVNDRALSNGVEPAADSDEEDPEESLRPSEKRSDEPPPLPVDYRITVMRRILEMCSRDTYTNITDFDWYIDILVKLVRVCPAAQVVSSGALTLRDGDCVEMAKDISYNIGHELQNVAVRVRSVRPEATQAAQSLVLVDTRGELFPPSGNGGQGVLGAAAWIVGEFAESLTKPDAVMSSMLHSSTVHLPADVLAIYLQSILKTFANVTGSQQISWSAHRRSTVLLLMARIVHFLEPLATHPDLEVQERAVEYLELMRLASEAASGHEVLADDADFAEPPLLLTQAIPSLFTGLELNPVAPTALKKVPLPEDLDLDMLINDRLNDLLHQADQDILSDSEGDETYAFYNHRIAATSEPVPAVDRLAAETPGTTSYQQDMASDDSDRITRRRAERRERHKDDPFYIANEDNSGASTPLHNILRNSNGEELDIDSIPIMDLGLDDKDGSGNDKASDTTANATAKRRSRRNFDIIVDENIGQDEPAPADSNRPDLVRSAPSKGKKSLLEVDSSGLGSLSLEGGAESQLDMEQREAEERALKEVERLRLEMQRASERIQARDVPPEGTLVKRKKKKKAKPAEGSPEEGAGGEGSTEAVTVKKKKTKAKGKDGLQDATEIVKPKKKSRRPIAFNDDVAGENT